MTEAASSRRPRVVVVGAGFGGVRVAQGLRGAAVSVLVLDQHNYHTFIPLLYQVATAGLELDQIAQPIRRMLRGLPNVRFRLARVTGFDLDGRRVITDRGDFEYDYLVLAAGSVTNYFGLESVAGTACALRDLDDAERLRDRVLSAFEAATIERDAGRRRELMTVAIVGGGPTGVELAGALAELRRHVLPRDYPDLEIDSARILLIEATDHLLPGMDASMHAGALEQLRRLGVEVMLNTAVTGADGRGVTLSSGERIPAGVIAWVAGLRASPLTEALPAERGKSGRLLVSETLQLPGRAEVYAIGDMVHVGGAQGQAYPMVAPVAIQQAELVARNILCQMEGKRPRRFRYRDRGTMVTVGRSAAVARVYGVFVSGFPAWLLWLLVHLIWLVGFRNRLLVLINWAWNYFTYERAVRLIRRR